MAQITITGTVKDTNGTIPTSGTLTFTLDNYFIDSTGIIIPAKAESTTVSPSDGTFSIVLGSTLDATPSTRSYGVSFSGVIESANVTQALGSIQLAASPTSVLLKDLIISGISGGIAVTPTLVAADVSLTLKETDQTLPAGLWRFRLNGDVLTIEKNTAAGGDFSTLTEIYRSTESLWTLNLPQRISANEPRLQFYESDQASDEKLWDFDLQAKVFKLRTRTDADGTGIDILSATRGTGTAISNLTVGTILKISTIEPRLQFYESDQASDEKLWDFDLQAKVLTLRTRTDADGAGVDILTITRGTGTAITSSVFSGTLQATRLGLGIAPDATAVLKLNGSIVGAIVDSTVAGHSLGGATDPSTQLMIQGSVGSSAGSSLGLTSSFSPGANQNVQIISLGCIVNKASSGTHSLFALIGLSTCSWGAGGAAVTNLVGIDIATQTAPASTTTASGLRVAAPTNATNNYAINVTSGTINIATGGSTTISTGVGSIKMSTANAATNAAWIPIQYAGTIYYVPAFTTNAP